MFLSAWLITLALCINSHRLSAFRKSRNINIFAISSTKEEHPNSVFHVVLTNDHRAI